MMRQDRCETTIQVRNLITLTDLACSVSMTTNAADTTPEDDALYDRQTLLILPSVASRRLDDGYLDDGYHEQFREVVAAYYFCKRAGVNYADRGGSHSPHQPFGVGYIYSLVLNGCHTCD